MKKIVFLLMVFVLMMALIPGVLAAAPAPGGPFKTEFYVQNLEATNAKCTYAFYTAAGVAAYTSSEVTILPGDKLRVYTPDIATLAAGEYSGVVSCDKKVAATVNFSDPNSGAAFNGVDTPSTVFYAPAIYDNYYGYFSNIYIQNASTSPVNITVDIYAAGGAVPVKTQTATAVPAYAAVHFEQEGLAELANNVAYSAKITGTGDLAAIVNIYGGTGEDQLYSYTAYASGGVVAYAPLIMNGYYGYNTSMTIQNLGTETANVTVDYTGPSTVTNNYTIGPNSSLAIYSPNVVPINATHSYAAKVTSTNSKPIVVLVNESVIGGLQAASYDGFVAGSNEVRIPVVMKNYYTFNTSINCQNVGTAATTFTISYAGVAGSTTSPSLLPGAKAEIYQPSDPILAAVPANWSSSATIISSGQPLVCVVNESSGTVAGDQLYSFNGVAP
jgi:hypothetical protein